MSELHREATISVLPLSVQSDWLPRRKEGRDAVTQPMRRAESVGESGVFSPSTRGKTPPPALTIKLKPSSTALDVRDPLLATPNNVRGRLKTWL